MKWGDQSMDNQNLTIALIAGIAASLGASLLGNFVILQRVALAADVLSHVALPGIALALAYNVNPFLGAFVFLIIAALALWRLEKSTKLPFDALVGIIFSVALAAGQLLFNNVTSEELLESLFGSLDKATSFDALAAVIVGVLVLVVFGFLYRPFVLSLISPDLARVQGIRAERMKLIFLLLLAASVAVGIKITGILFIGALLIFPAAIASNVNRSFAGALATSAVVGVAGTASGIFIGIRSGLDAGALIIMTLAVVFLISLPFRALLRRRAV